MSEVLKSNFNELLPQIKQSLSKAAFIGIDSEFSGLVSHSKLKNSLFDTSSDRYIKLKCSIEQFTIFQFGLSIFHYNRDSNQYIADVYCFYTFPSSFGPVDSRFLCQATSWEFLRSHNFNFNKVAYEGIPFMNIVQEELIRKQLGEGTMFSNVERSLSYREEDDLQAACSKVALWLPLASIGDSILLPVSNTDYSLSYFIHKEVRLRFRDVWTITEQGQVRVNKMTFDQIREAQEKEGDQLDLLLIDNLLGFSKVFNLLVELKKPLVGHNLLLDLMIMYNQMYHPLPNNYDAFKNQLNSLFPSLFDTKFISYRVRDILRRKDEWSSNRLDDLYVYFDSGKGRSLASFSPMISVNNNVCTIENVEAHLHEAAWDAYMAGYCFIRLTHFLAIRRLGESALPRALSRVEHLSAVAEYCNCINIIRASVSHMNIGGSEPPSHRPRLLLITTRDYKPIRVNQVAALLASHGSSSVDVKIHSSYSALVAVPNKHTARDIARSFAGDTKYKVVPYSYLKHSSFLTAILWSGAVFTGSICLAMLVKRVAIYK